jgi:predicted DNA-binding protein (UPF0251 family)
MPRPKRPRWIAEHPETKGFRPFGKNDTGEIILSLEEFAALKHIDIEGLDQAGAALIMNISRQTFGRILKEARYKTTKALVSSKKLIIQGGCYKIHNCDKGRRHGRNRRFQRR